MLYRGKTKSHICTSRLCLTHYHAAIKTFYAQHAHLLVDFFPYGPLTTKSLKEFFSEHLFLENPQHARPV